MFKQRRFAYSALAGGNGPTPRLVSLSTRSLARVPSSHSGSITGVDESRRESTPALPLPDQSCRRHPVPSAVRRRRYGLLPRTQYLYNLTSININKCALGDAGLVESDRTRSWVSLVPKRRMTSHDMMSLRARCPRGYHATDSITLSANAVRGNQTYMVTLGTGNDDYK